MKHRALRRYRYGDVFRSHDVTENSVLMLVRQLVPGYPWSDWLAILLVADRFTWQPGATITFRLPNENWYRVEPDA